VLTLRRKVVECKPLAYGTDLFRKPLAATGRADYFGALPNLAARIMGRGFIHSSTSQLTLSRFSNKPHTLDTP
jgi:hypothetical protein